MADYVTGARSVIGQFQEITNPGRPSCEAHLVADPSRGRRPDILKLERAEPTLRAELRRES